MLLPRASWHHLGPILLAAAGAACTGEALAKGKPNVVLVVVDTLRADMVNDPAGKVATPSLDALAEEGARFPRAFSHAPMTLPSHTSLFSSRFPHETRVKVNGQPVPEDLPLLGAHLEDVGYRTAAVVSLSTLVRASAGGKSLDRSFEHFEKAPGHISTAAAIAQHVRDVLEGLPADRPFFLFAHFADPHEPYDAHGSVTRDADVLLNGKLLERVTTSDPTSWDEDVELQPGQNVLELRGEHPIHLRFLQVRRGKEAVEPTFLEGGVRQRTPVVRIALENPGDDVDKVRVSFWLTDLPSIDEQRARYVREVEFADGYVGQLLQELKDRGLYDDTLVVFTSDHGEALGERGGTGHAHTLFDELIHVPLIVKPPLESSALAKLRERSDEVVTHLDVVPTMLDLLGLPPLSGQRGRSLLSAKGEVPAFSETHRPEAFHDLLALRDGRWKLIYTADEDRFELFDLEKDPGERTDVFPKEGERFAAWQEELRAAAELGRDESLDMDNIDPAVLEQMRAIGYFGR